MEKKYKMFASKMREDLYRSLKLFSAAEGKSIQTLLEEAVTEYLDNRRFQKEELPGGKLRTTMVLSLSHDVATDKKKKPKK